MPPSDDQKIDLIQELGAICYELNWVISLPIDQAMISGLIIGNIEYVIKHSDIAYGKNDYLKKEFFYDIFRGDPETGAMVEIIPDTTTNTKRGTMH